MKIINPQNKANIIKILKSKKRLINRNFKKSHGIL